MNVIINLPDNLIRAIAWGEKFFLIRSKKPLHFNKNNDVVFVVQKGTKSVPLYFTIYDFYNFYPSFNDLMSNKYYVSECIFLAKKASVSYEYVHKYRKGKNYISAWVIGCACKVYSPSCLYSALRIERNPQSFIYRDYEWRKIEFTSYEWLNKPKNIYPVLDPTIEYERYMRSLSSANLNT